MYARKEIWRVQLHEYVQYRVQYVALWSEPTSYLRGGRVQVCLPACLPTYLPTSVGMQHRLPALWLDVKQEQGFAVNSHLLTVPVARCALQHTGNVSASIAGGRPIPPILRL